MEQKEPRWKVLLIGGPSGIGKTYLTKKLSSHYGCPYIRIDHLRFFMKEILKNDGEQSASLFDETESISDNNYQKLAQFIHQNRVLWRNADIILLRRLGVDLI